MRHRYHVLQSCELGTDIRDNLRATGFIRCGEESWGTGGDPLSLARQI
jgi:hypothetical protein